MNFRRACHKLRMYQRRHDQLNRKRDYHIPAKDYEEYHKQQRRQLATAIKQLLEPPTI